MILNNDNNNNSILGHRCNCHDLTRTCVSQNQTSDFIFYSFNKLIRIVSGIVLSEVSQSEKDK